MSKIIVKERQMATANGSVFVKCWLPAGDGARQRLPIILLHDSIGCVTLWRDFPELLARTLDREVIAYDRLGFGASAVYPGPQPLSFIFDEAETTFAALLENLALDRFVLFGHSVGGGMAVACAAAYPERCAALFTESAQAFVEDFTLAGVRRAERAFAEPGQLTRLQKYHGDKAEWALRAWFDTWQAQAFQSFSLDEALARIHCPLCAIHGDDDDYGTDAHPRRIVALARGVTRLALLPGCGHVPHRTAPEQIRDIVQTFLAEHHIP